MRLEDRDAAIELLQLEDDLRTLRAKEAKHRVYALLGASPSAILLFLAVLLEPAALYLLVLLFLIVPVWEVARWLRTMRDVRDVERAIRDLEALPPAGSTE